MAIYRGGRLVGAGGGIASTVLTDGVTLEGDGTENNRVRLKTAGINTVHLGENVVTLAKLAHGEANRVLVYDNAGALVEGQKYAPKAVWWGLNQTGRIEPRRRLVADYDRRTAILRFKGSDPDETYFGGDSLGDIMQAAPASESFIDTNVDTDYPDGDNERLTLYANQFFQLPAGVWNLHCYVEDSGSHVAQGHLALMEIMSGSDDVVLFHTPGWQDTQAYGGTTFYLSIPLLETEGTEYFYLRFESVTTNTTNYAYFLLLEKLQ